MKIDKGLITYVTRGKGPSQTPYRVEDLDVTVTGQGSQLAFKGAFAVRPGDLTVKLADGIIAVNGAKTLLEAPVRARVGIEGKDVEKLVAAAAGPTPTIAGPIKGDFSLGGTLGVPRISGNVELASVRVTRSNQACPEPKQRTLALGLLKVSGASWDGARFRFVGEETAGGYAAELTPEQQREQQQALEARIPDFDVVITTALVPGRPAPRLVTKETVAGMRPGSVIVDLAAEAGGNCELTEPGSETEHRGVRIIGFTNLASSMPAHASQLYSRNVSALLQHLAPEGELALDWDDEITAATCVTRTKAAV